MFYTLENQIDGFLRDIASSSTISSPQLADHIIVAKHDDFYQSRHWETRAYIMKYTMAEAIRFLSTLPGKENEIAVLEELRFLRGENPPLTNGERETLAKDMVRAALLEDPNRNATLRDWSIYPRLGRWAKEWSTPAVRTGVHGRRPRNVERIETGERWPSANALAADLGASLQTVYAHLGGDRRYKTVRGQTYRYVD